MGKTVSKKALVDFVVKIQRRACEVREELDQLGCADAEFEEMPPEAKVIVEAFQARCDKFDSEVPLEARVEAIKEADKILQKTGARY